MPSRVSYKFLRALKDDEKLPSQAATIVATLGKMAGDSKDKLISRDDLVTELEKADGEKPNMLNAKQPVERVIAFYQKRLADEGFIEIHKPAAAPKTKDGKKSAEPKGKAKVPSAEETAASMQV